MSRFARKIRRFVRNDRKSRLEVAEDLVFRTLEERWAQELKGQPIPPRHRVVMRRDPAFRILVATAIQGGSIALPDLDSTPIETRDQDGTPRNLFLTEMAGDPRPFYCSDCGDTEVGRAGDRCIDCTTLYPED